MGTQGVGRMVYAAILAATVSGVAMAAQVAADFDTIAGNLIQNGSFEFPDITAEPNYNGNRWHLVNPDTWDATPITAEIMRGWGRNEAAHGEQWVELRSTNRTSIYQDVIIETEGRYGLTFYTRDRPGTSANANAVNYYAFGIDTAGQPQASPYSAPPQDTLLAGTVGGGFTAWHGHTFYFEAAASTILRVMFAAGGGPDPTSIGGWLDAVSLVYAPLPPDIGTGGAVVPVPPAALLGAVGLGMIGWWRRRGR